MTREIALCRLHRDLAPLARSHIIPEVLYKPSYDERHKAVEISGDMSRECWLQKGYRERLLCDWCEGYMNDTFEKPFQEEWIDSGLVPDYVENDDRVVPFKINYRTLKLFQLSVLWRASVSRIPQFSDVVLGPHEDRVRQMLIDQVPGTESDYPVIGVLLHLDNTVAKATLLAHTRSRMDGLTYYTSIYAGCMWLQFTARSVPHELRPLVLREDGTLPLVVKKFTDLKFIQKYIRELRTRGSRLRER